MISTILKSLPKKISTTGSRFSKLISFADDLQEDIAIRTI